LVSSVGLSVGRDGVEVMDGLDLHVMGDRE